MAAAACCGRCTAAWGAHLPPKGHRWCVMARGGGVGGAGRRGGCGGAAAMLAVGLASATRPPTSTRFWFQTDCVADRSQCGMHVDWPKRSPKVCARHVCHLKYRRLRATSSIQGLDLPEGDTDSFQSPCTKDCTIVVLRPNGKAKASVLSPAPPQSAICVATRG